MTASILVATPHPAFGELLKSSLEDGGKYRVYVSLSAREARASALHGVFQLAILDFALSDEPFIPLCYDLLDQQKGLRLVVVPPENNPNHPALGGLMPHGYLSRPFYLPDLLETVGRLLDERAASSAATGVNGQAGEPAGLPAGSPVGSSHGLPGWLTDPETLTRHLEQQLPSTQALAALVGISDLTPGSGILRASAGKLKPAAAQEMTNVVFRYWNRQKKADLMRYVRLNSEKQDFLIYATPLSGELVLTLVYDTNAPLSQVRPQTKAVAQAVSTVPPDAPQTSGQEAGADGSKPAKDAPNQPEASGEGRSQEAGSKTSGDQPPAVSPDTPAGQMDAAQPEKPAGVKIFNNPQGASVMPASSRTESREPTREFARPAAQEPETQPLDDPMLFASAGSTGSGEPSVPSQESISGFEPEAYGEETNQLINLSSLLGSIPQPDPGTELPAPFNAGWMSDSPPSNARSQIGSGGWQTAVDMNGPANLPGELSGGMQGAVVYPLPNEPAEPNGEDAGSASARPAGKPERALQDAETGERQLVAGSEPAIDPLEDTRPRVLSAINSLNQLEPVSPALSLLNYTCVLVPRLPQHYLTGELADRLSQWVQQLCLAFGWRLEGISVRPEYLQWTLQVAPSVSPGNLVRIIRQRTSINIFNNFAHLAEQNPSGDFWATGYLIVSGSQPPSAQLLRDYISQTRKRQGISR